MKRPMSAVLRRPAQGAASTRCATGARSLTVLVSSVLMGPLVLLAISGLVASLESRAEQREVYVAGIEHAPTLRNFLERQTYIVKEAPADFEARLRRSTFSDPVVVVPPTSRPRSCAATSPVVEIVSDSAEPALARRATARIERLLGGFSRERALLSLALRGVSAQLLEPMQVEDRDLASTQTRATRITGMLPYFVMMAVLYGALNAALDTTAGERERGSLEPLLMNPAERWALVAGKWGAVACVEHADRRPQLLQLPARPVGAAQRHAGGDVPVRAARGGAVHRHPAAARRGAGGGADGGRDPLPHVQGGAGELDRRRPGGVAAAARQRLRSRRRGALAPVGAGAGAEHADDARAEGRGARRRAGA